MKNLKSSKRYLMPFLIIAVLVALLVTFTACEELGYPPPSQPTEKAEPEKVNITEESSDTGLVIKLEVAPDDKGRVIGKQGRVAEAIRTLLRVKGAREDIRVRLEIV